MSATTGGCGMGIEDTRYRVDGRGNHKGSQSEEGATRKEGRDYVERGGERRETEVRVSLTESSQRLE